VEAAQGSSPVSVDPSEWTWGGSGISNMGIVVFSHRAFRKQYYRAKRAHRTLAQKGAFTLRLAARVETQTGTAEFKTPDDAGAVRFAVLMRPFLDPASDYHYRKVFEQIAAEAPKRISAADRASVEEEVVAIEAGDISLAINDQRIRAHDLYVLLAQGEFFDSDQKALAQLRELRPMPLFGPLAWYHFYSFTVSIYHHVGRLYRLSWEIQRGQGNAPDVPSASKCLFCSRSDRAFTSEEHVLPEALGNDEMVLPPGRVCDACNNALSVLDTELVDFPPVALLRVLYVPHTKKGRLPSADFDGVSFRKTNPRRLEIRSRDKAPEQVVQADGSVSVKWTFQGTRPIAPHRLARALFKIGLELLAYDCGPLRAFDGRYDAAREFVRGTRATFPNHFMLCTEGKPKPGIQTTQFTDLAGTPTFVDIFGVLFAFNLEPSPRLDASKIPGGPFTAFDLSIPTQCDAKLESEALPSSCSTSSSERLAPKGETTS
jgi:hypothetical protein